MSARPFADLLAHPGVVEECSLRSPMGVMAYHGGDLEVGTDQIADAVARRTGASCYLVRQPDGLRRHVPSAQVLAAHSEHLRRFLGHIEEVVTLHGFGRRSMFTTVLLGGRNRSLARCVARHLRASLPAYEVVDDLDHVPLPLRGLHPDNPVNQPRGGGVQIELPPRIRGNGPFWNGWDGGWPTPHTEALIDGLSAAVSERAPTLAALAFRAPGVP